MEIVTKRKIIYNTDYSNACGCSGVDGYSNAGGDEKKKFGEKLKGAYGKSAEWLKANPEQAAQLKQLGGALVQKVIKGKTDTSTSTGTTETRNINITMPEQSGGLSQNAKIGLAIGGVVALGIVIYLATKK
jgi:hypothetical protein